MKKWTTPMAMEECFTANVDVAVAVTTCYKVACEADEANKYEEGHPFWGFYPLKHSGKRCTFSQNNVIQIDPKTHKITGMIGDYEEGKVECQFTDSNYQAISPGDLQVDQRVYWTSPGRFNLVIGSEYHHQGILKLTDPNNKCMS